MLSNAEKSRRFWNRRRAIYAQLAKQRDASAAPFAWKTRAHEWQLLLHCRKWEPAFTPEIDAKILRWRIREIPMSWKRIGSRLQIPWPVVRQRGVGLGFPIQTPKKEASFATRQRSSWNLAESGDPDEDGDPFTGGNDSDDADVP